MIPLDHEPHPCLSVVMPAYNEQATVSDAIEAVLSSPWVAQLVVVDDCSTDATPTILDALTDERITKPRHGINQGKGAALRTGTAHAPADRKSVAEGRSASGRVETGGRRKN